MQILQNVIKPPALTYAALSQYVQEPFHKFAQREPQAPQEIHDRPHMGQQRRGPHHRRVHNHSSQT